MPSGQLCFRRATQTLPGGSAALSNWNYRALASIKSACKWAALANVLWARPDGQGGMTSSPDELERELTQQFYRVSTDAASTFQERLDYASLCTEFEDMQSIVDLNTKLYYLTPKPVKATSVATLDDLCRA